MTIKVSIAVIESHDQKQVGEGEVLFQLKFLGYTQGRQGKQSRQKPEGRN